MFCWRSLNDPFPGTSCKYKACQYKVAERLRKFPDQLTAKIYFHTKHHIVARSIYTEQKNLRFGLHSALFFCWNKNSISYLHLKNKQGMSNFIYRGIDGMYAVREHGTSEFFTKYLQA